MVLRSLRIPLLSCIAVQAGCFTIPGGSADASSEGSTTDAAASSDGDASESSGSVDADDDEEALESSDGGTTSAASTSSGSATGTQTTTFGTSTGDDDTGTTGIHIGTTSGGDGTTTSSTDSDTKDSGGDADALCTLWNTARQDRSEGDWSGSIATCDPGDISANGRANALRLVNLYRTMAGLPDVTDDSSLNEQAQACALLQHANGTLSHDPPQSWECWTEVGATASGRSNISTGPGVMSVDMYMVDWGNATTLGHRRWILSNSAGPIGLGSTSDSSCMYILGGQGRADAAWTAYPPPGPFPLEAFEPLPFGETLDETGWSIQSDMIDLAGAQVEITVDGTPMPVRVTQLLSGYGSRHAISIIPQGWASTAGTRYHVEVQGISQPIAYDVDVVDCG